MKLARRLSLLGILVSLAACALVVRPEVEPSADPGPNKAKRAGIVTIDSAKIPLDLSSPYWDKIRSGKTLVIGVNRRYPPFGAPTKPGSKRAWVGFDIEIAEHLGRTLGVPIEIRGMASADIGEALATGEIDLAMAGLTRTVERSVQVNFSSPYLVVSLGALIERRFVEGTQGTDEERRRNSFDSYFDLAQIPGLRIGVADNTRPQRLASAQFREAKLIPYPDANTAAEALARGEVNAVVHDAPAIRAWQVLNPSLGRRFTALLAPATEEPICIAIRKGDLEFLRFLDVYVEEIRHDGTIKRYYQRHFVDSAWAKQSDLGGAK
ncbi:MAG: transporter substrate-binding domain-containing protein [Planctomycetes bacterium]|nr:transporter substrate-binding domain-containing protein [Planctomycetota bacterium]